MRQQDTIPRWFLIAGLVAWPGTAALMIRLVWEQTLLTAERGPQMVGFALMHGALGGAGLPMLLSSLALHFWSVLAVPALVYQVARGRSLRRFPVVLLAAVLAVLALLQVPYGYWRYGVLRTVGAGVHGASHLTFAAAYGENYNVRELLSQGVPVDATSGAGNAALSAACVRGHLETARLLVAAGADVNKTDGLIHRTPLMNASEMDQPDIVEYLLGVGADPRRADKDGKTALTIAREARNERAVAALERALQ